MFKSLHPLFLSTILISFLLFQNCKGTQEITTHKQWHTITLSFEGPVTSEAAADNPFLNYALEVKFQHDKSQQTIRGFYAADGNAAESSAEEGNVWQVRFTPNLQGDWTYQAKLVKGENIALNNNLNEGESIPINNDKGSFQVIASTATGEDFRAKGRIVADGGHFKFWNTNNYWLKMGTNSPENLLAYHEIDGTYRTAASAEEGESAAPEEVHRFEKHVKDWNATDPTWKNGKGKAMIGGINYLASKGMNTMYFLTMNIGGDGKDVWPYLKPDDFTRFDVSKLDQWEIIFQHMQSKGILMHVVTQETENEKMLDDGDTGTLRQLYYRELIARFGHHLALIWNLGEENGVAGFTPNGQNDDQRKAMTKFLKETDPYQHPVLLHTHSHEPYRGKILEAIKGYSYLDGLSFQQDKRENTAEKITYWKDQAKAANHEWAISMDEIGMWHTGAVPDSFSANHDTIRHHVLWGSLLSGASGVEWYFGAKFPHNDLGSEDWSQRDRLWEITKHAKDFFDEHLPYWDMDHQHKLIDAEGGFCLRKPNVSYAVYLPQSGEYNLDLSESEGAFNVHWYNPLEGGKLQEGSVKSINGGSIQSLGAPPSISNPSNPQDWVILVKK